MKRAVLCGVFALAFFASFNPAFAQAGDACGISRIHPTTLNFGEVEAGELSDSLSYTIFNVESSHLREAAISTTAWVADVGDAEVMESRVTRSSRITDHPYEGPLVSAKRSLPTSVPGTPGSFSGNRIRYFQIRADLLQEGFTGAVTQQIEQHFRMLRSPHRIIPGCVAKTITLRATIVASQVTYSLNDVTSVGEEDGSVVYTLTAQSANAITGSRTQYAHITFGDGADNADTDGVTLIEVVLDPQNSTNCNASGMDASGASATHYCARKNVFPFRLRMTP